MRKDDPLNQPRIRNWMIALKASLQGLYGTDLHVKIQEEHDHAAQAIIRMSEEADKVVKQQQEPIIHLDQALEAIVRDMQR